MKARGDGGSCGGRPGRSSLPERAWEVDRYGEDGTDGTGGMSRGEWLRFDPVVDERPFLVRLVSSVKVKLGWAGGLKGKPKVEVTGGTDF